MGISIGGQGIVAEPRRGPAYDLWLILSAGLLLGCGFFLLYSIDSARLGSNFMAKQMVFAAVGVPVFLVMAKVSLATWRKLSVPLYIFNVALLASTLLMHHKKNGSARWINIGPLEFQPSELSKVFIVLTLMAFFMNREDDLKSPRTILLSLLHISPFVVLLLLQPHFGGAMCIVMAWLTMSIYAGVPWKWLLAVTVAAVGFCALAWNTTFILKANDYHRDRIREMLGIGDTNKNGYQQRMAGLAIGSGGWGGQGYLQGQVKKAGFIPEQESDFVFSVVGEEGGLVGCGLVLLLYVFFFYRVWLLGFRTRAPAARLVVAGIFGILAFHTLVNLAMVLRIGPVIGIWLPFLSYGGTALLMCMASVGLLQQARQVN